MIMQILKMVILSLMLSSCAFMTSQPDQKCQMPQVPPSLMEQPQQLHLISSPTITNSAMNTKQN